eukprot:scaffold28063_cov52-Attheya_sp.AAC.6
MSDNLLVCECAPSLDVDHQQFKEKRLQIEQAHSIILQIKQDETRRRPQDIQNASPPIQATNGSNSYLRGKGDSV